ncbi:MAG: universal stress protein [Lutibacter sp.]|uniref:universal stress protein n=1 Tax=Lutibacter sp. TaxID=1925666 RepID=UPI00299D53C3|nr:universal stress protein [Lutibacter sp.]MDX1829011.1 universal stress protein [Lutibacter sp.]
MKTILCAVDYSENSITALKFAYALSKKIKANLFVFHVYNYPSLGSNLNEPYLLFGKELFESCKIKLKEFCESNLKIDLKKENITIDVVENNSVTNEILTKSEELNSYIIVAGMKGENILKGFIMGSTTLQLIDKAPCPIFAIPNGFILKNIKTIVYASDFEEEDIAAIHKLTEIIKPFNSNIKVIHISIKDEDEATLTMEWFKELLKQKVNYEKIEFEVVYSENIFNSLKTYIKNTNTDLIAMMERKKTGFIRKIFREDLVKKMEIYGKVPLISFNEANY